MGRTRKYQRFSPEFKREAVKRASDVSQFLGRHQASVHLIYFSLR